jgi:hypothetical protein
LLAIFPVKLLSTKYGYASSLQDPPPIWAILPLKVQLINLGLALSSNAMPPP